MSALTSLLVRDGVVPVRKIEEALQRQVISGGDVETVLLEMDALPENVLAAYRAALYGLGPASREEIMSVAPEVVGLVPAEVAIEHKLIPLSVHGSVLEVALREPLSTEQEERLGFLLGFDLVARIACEVRVAAGLAHHYAAELSPRFTRLIDRLRKRDSGEATRPRVSGALAAHASDIPYKHHEHFEGRTRPLDPRVQPDRPRRPTNPGMGRVTAETAELAEAAERARLAEEAPPSEPRRAPVASLPEDEELDGGPVVFPSEPGRGEPRRGEPGASEPARGALRPPRRTSSSPALKLLRGPLTLAAGERMLKRVSDRDQILEVFFSYARQFFDYTALFVVQENAADGREAWGPGASTEEVQAVSVPLDRPSVFAEVRRTTAPLVRRLGATDVERDVALGLRRPTTPPALILPIAIRQRVVLLLYGDRGGEEFDLGAVMELVRFASRVVEAFELLILRKKRAGYHERGASRDPGSLKSAAKVVAETAGRGRPSADRRRHESGAWRPGRRFAGVFAPVLELGGADSWSSATPDQPPSAVVHPPRSEAAPVIAGEAAPVTAGEAAPAEAPPVSAEPSPPPRRVRRAPSQVDGPPQLVLGIPRDAPPPPPSAEIDLGALQIAAALAEPVREEEPEMIVDVDDADEEDLEAIAELEAQVERDRERERAQARARAEGTYRMPGGRVDVVRATPSEPLERPASRPRARMVRDPRRDGDDSSSGGSGRPVVATDVVRPPASLRPPRGADPETRSVIVDMGEQVHAQVADLIAAQSEERRAELIRGLFFLGEAALPALVQAFPGPLSWDRHAPSGPIPAGRDVSVVARALVAFGERAVPYVSALMSSGQADQRFYAALVAAELVHPDLIDAAAERIHDPDPGVRRIACALLPRLAGYRGFEEVRVVIRRTARLRGKDTSRRWQAVDALAALRDVAIVDKLIDLLKEDDAELVDHVHRALVILTCDDMGRSHRRWRAWHDKRGERHRVEWLIDGLMHDDASIRTLAGTELERLTQERYGYQPGAPRRDRERVQRRYRRWWEDDGRRRFV